MAQPPERRSATRSSPVGAALERVGDRWSLLVVEALLGGQRRYNDLLEALPGIAPNILADRLRRLERDGLVVARPYSERPPRMDYELTAGGSDLAGVLRLLADWGARRASPVGSPHEPTRHDACGTALEARWYCPTCTIVVGDAEASATRSV